MIKIRKGNSTLTVTHGAYKNYYKHLGYEPVGVATDGENPGEENTHPHDDSQHCGDSTHLNDGEGTPDDEEGEDFSEDEEEASDDEVNLSEIPLGEMGLEQLHAYAEELGLDHEEIASKKKLRALIREHLN